MALPQKKKKKEAWWEESRFLRAGWLGEMMDSETGLTQVHLLCSGSGAKIAWQWCDTKSLSVKEAGTRPPIKAQRHWVTFHRAQLVDCDSMPTHYSWRVVCLARVTTRWVSLPELCACVFDNLTAFLPVTVWLIWVIFYTCSLFEFSIINTVVGVEKKWTSATFVSHTIKQGKVQHKPQI